MGHPPTINPCHTTVHESIGVPFGMVDETIFVFHMSHPDDFCAPQPSRTIMGHPPTINPCHTTGHESIGVPLWHG
jgi:hypothetical protein